MTNEEVRVRLSGQWTGQRNVAKWAHDRPAVFHPTAKAEGVVALDPAGKAVRSLLMVFDGVCVCHDLQHDPGPGHLYAAVVEGKAGLIDTNLGSCRGD